MGAQDISKSPWISPAAGLHSTTFRAVTPDQQRIIDGYLVTGQTGDRHWEAWDGDTTIACMKVADDALTDALVAAVKSREKNVRIPPVPSPAELVQMTRTRVESMARGLFARAEQEVVLGLLEKSVVFLTPDNIETVLRGENFGAWDIANLYLLSIRADLLGPDSMRIVGLSQETTCYVSTEYLGGRGKFDDFIVHEAGHVFHNWKREYAGLPFTRQKEWLLDIAFAKRETFAWSCEVYARILEQSRSLAERVGLVEEYAKHPSTDEQVDAAEHVDILREAVRARNGWKRILARCAPPPRQRNDPPLAVRP